MLTVLFCLIMYIARPDIINWVERSIFTLIFILDLVLEACGLIALYNLFTRL